jgi:hypothetical protein
MHLNEIKHPIYYFYVVKEKFKKTQRVKKSKAVTQEALKNYNLRKYSTNELFFCFDFEPE